MRFVQAFITTYLFLLCLLTGMTTIVIGLIDWMIPMSDLWKGIVRTIIVVMFLTIFMCNRFKIDFTFRDTRIIFLKNYK